MDKVKKFSFKTLITLLLVAVIAVSVAMFAACSGSSSSTDSSSSTNSSSTEDSSSSSRTDYQEVANGDFEYKHDSATSFPVTSSIGWTRAYDSITTTAVSSNKSSGIIDTTAGEAYNTFAADNGFPKNADETYYNPSTPEALGYIPASELYTYDEEVTNIDKLPTSGSYILMIHNATDNGAGTAQRFTSSTTITVSSYGKISLWVLTKDLSSKMEATEYGAYISLTNSLSSAKAPLVINNINTDGEWQKFEFYLEASDYSTSTFKVILGLGNGSKEYQAEYVEGFAFFDNIYYESITAAEYEEATAAGKLCKDVISAYADSTVDSYYYNAETDDFDATPVPVYDYAKENDLILSYNDQEAFTKTVGTKNYNYYAYGFSHKMPIMAYPEAMVGMFIETEVNEDKFVSQLAYTMDTEIGYGAFNAIASDKVADVTNPMGDDATTLYMIHNNGASSTATLALPFFCVPDGTAMYVSFLAKVDAGINQSGLTVKVIDLGSAKTTAEEKTTLLTSVTTSSVEDEDLNDWVRVNLFITNFVGDKYERYFSLELDFGTTTEVQKQILLTEGYALITDIEGTYISKAEYNAASRSGSYDASASLGAEINNVDLGEEEDDSYAIGYAESQKTLIGSEVVNNITGYTGVVGGNKAVGGDKTDYSDENVIAGVINTKYLDNYASLAAVKSELQSLTPDEDNTYVQPIIIYNKAAASYGYISESGTLSAKSTTLVSVKLRVFGNANAYVYLTSTDPLSKFEILSLEGKKVNRDGNKPVYSTDPADAEVYAELLFTVNAADCDDDWITVNFLVTAGDNGIPYRVEIFNGTRDNSEDSTGLVVIDSVTKTTENASSFKAKTISEFGTSEYDVVKTYAGVVKTVKYTDSDGFDAVKYTSDPSEIEVYTYLDNAKTMIVSYENIDVDTELDETTTANDNSTDEKSDEDKEREANHSVWLQITSIIIAIVLILVLIILAFRAIFKKFRKEETTTETYYNRNSREKAQDVINRNKAKREEAAKNKAEEPEEKKEYDYDNPENNV